MYNEGIMVFDEQKLLEVFHYSPFIIYFWYWYFLVVILSYVQILKIIELDIKCIHRFNEDKQLVHSETSCPGTQLDG